MISLKRGRSNTLDASSGAQRIPLGPVRPKVNVATANTATEAPIKLPLRPQRPPLAIRQSETAPELSRLAREPEPEAEPEPESEHEEGEEDEDELSAEEDSMEIEEEEEKEVAEQVATSEPVTEKEAVEAETEFEVKSKEEDEEDEVPVELIWPEISPKAADKYRKEIEHIQKTFNDEVDMFDTTMVSEYSDEIFEYMSKLEVTRSTSAQLLAC